MALLEFPFIGRPAGAAIGGCRVAGGLFCVGVAPFVPFLTPLK